MKTECLLTRSEDLSKELHMLRINTVQNVTLSFFNTEFNIILLPIRTSPT